MAIGVNTEGYRAFSAYVLAPGRMNRAGPISFFLRHLKERGVKGVRPVTSDKASGLAGLIGNFFPGASWQRCIVHFERNVFKGVPANKAEEAGIMLRAIFSQESSKTALEKTGKAVSRLREMNCQELQERLNKVSERH